MRARIFRLGAAAIIAVACAGIMGCDDDDDVLNTGGGGTTGADIDVTASTPASGNTNISGAGVTVATSADTLNGTPVTRVQVDATTSGFKRRVLVYFETAGGAPSAVSCFWGVSDVTENIVYCPAAGCTGVTVNQTTKELSFSSTALDNNDPFGPPTKFATLSGGIQYQ